MNFPGHFERNAVEKSKARDRKNRAMGSPPEERLHENVQRSQNCDGIDMVHSTGSGRIEKGESAHGSAVGDDLRNESTHGMANENRGFLEFVLIHETLDRVGKIENR